MGFNKEGNGFTFGFAIILVVVVGTLLSVAAISLKPYQDENRRQEKMKYILMAIGEMNSKSDMKEAPAIFERLLKERITLNYSGEVISKKNGPINPKDNADPFNIDVKKEYKAMVKPILSKNKGDQAAITAALSKEKVNYPLYLLEKEGKKFYVAPMVGTGLWGPIWGYVAFEDDFNTLKGATFDHKSETPGLGSEITLDWFTKPFTGKRILNSVGAFESIHVVKGGADPHSNHEVDGITGGTITSNSVDEMLFRSMEIYNHYFEIIRN